MDIKKGGFMVEVYLDIPVSLKKICIKGIVVKNKNFKDKDENKSEDKDK